MSGCSLQFPIRQKRCQKQICRMTDRSQIFSNALTVNNIENIISRAFDDAV